MKKKVLLVDADPQGNATSGSGIPRIPSRKTLYNILLLNEPIRNVVLPTELPLLSVLPADKNLAGAEVELVDAEGRVSVKSLLSEIKSYMIT